ncbi:hypothetical protein BDR04DRAFT_283929 [Suillus decipiens]|nr:hypothetical protein BDR04DRAFT_283929 [Suillus decipiens]
MQDPEEPIKTILSCFHVQHCARCSYHDIFESFYPPYHKFAPAATISPPRISFTPSTFNTSVPPSILCQSIIEILLSFRHTCSIQTVNKNCVIKHCIIHGPLLYSSFQGTESAQLVSSGRNMEMYYGRSRKCGTKRWGTSLMVCDTCTSS